MTAARVEAILARDRRAIARAITAIEEDERQSAALVAALVPHLGKAKVIGITGPPGAGKSALVDALLGAWLGRGLRLGVLAVDPSSPKSGGAVLGDRIRMTHGADERVFIRSLAARGHLGGVSLATRRAVDVLDAAGFDVVVIETVGTGQSEVEVAETADCVVVVSPPGLGDDVQVLKAGVLEVADVLVVSKGDLPGAERTVRDLLDMTALRPRDAPALPVIRVSTMSGEGVEVLVEAIEAYIRAHGTAIRRLVADAPTAAAVLAVDTAMSSLRCVRQFLPMPVRRTLVEEILEVASRTRGGTDAPPWKVYALAGNEKDALCTAVVEAYDARDAKPDLDCDSTGFDSCLACRLPVGWNRHTLPGMGRADKAAMRAQYRRNYRFFDAPVGLIIAVDRRLRPGAWLECGMFLEKVMVAARTRGLDTCPEAAWMAFPDVIARTLALPQHEEVVCGMPLGYADPHAMENRLVTGIEPASSFARFSGFGS